MKTGRNRRALRCWLGYVLLLICLIAVGCGGASDSKSKPPQTKVDPAVVTIADTAGDWGFPSPFLHYQRGPGYIRMSLIFDT